MPLYPKYSNEQQYPACNILNLCDITGEYNADTNPGGYGGGGNPTMEEITQTKFLFTSPGSDISIAVDKGFLPADECVEISFNDYAQNAPEVCEYDTEFATYGISASILINNTTYSLGAVASLSALLTALNNLSKGVWSLTGTTTIEVVGGYNYSDLNIGGSVYSPTCPPPDTDDPCHTCGDTPSDSTATQSLSSFEDGCWQITYEVYTALVTGVYDLSAASFGGTFSVTINAVSNSLGTIASAGALVDALNSLGQGEWTNDSGIITVTGNYTYGDIVGAASFTPDITIIGNALYAAVTKNEFLNCNVTKQLVDLMMQRFRKPMCDVCDDNSNVDDQLTRLRTDYESMMLAVKVNPCNCETASFYLNKVLKGINNVMTNCFN